MLARNRQNVLRRTEQPLGNVTCWQNEGHINVNAGPTGRLASLGIQNSISEGFFACSYHASLRIITGFQKRYKRNDLRRQQLAFLARENFDNSIVKSGYRTIAWPFPKCDISGYLSRTLSKSARASARLQLLCHAFEANQMSEQFFQSLNLASSG